MPPMPSPNDHPDRPTDRRPLTLTARAVLVTCAVAVVSVLVTALVAVPLAIRAAQREQAEALGKETDAVTVLMNRTLRDVADQRLARQLRQHGIDLVLIRDGRPDRTGLPPALVERIEGGDDLRAERIRYQGRPALVEGRSLGGGDGVVLVEPQDGTLGRQVWQRLWLALVAGLLAGGLAGAMLARRLARPIRSAAVAAARLGAGDRGVRLPVEAPAEAAELATAINELAGALATSEDRQREFLLSVSHELRTPLTTLRGYAEALADGVVGPEGVSKTGQTMLREALHLDRLVTDLLALARLEAADFPISIVPVDLVALTNGVAEAWAARCAEVGAVLKVEVPAAQVEVPAAEVVVHTDPGRLRQVVDGLLENALRVVPAGAPIVLAVGPGTGEATIEVRDGGPGLTDDDLAVAFERAALYRRYQGVRKVGSGVGLALAARLVALLGGRIEAGHAPEGGARFTVHLRSRFT